ncbi:ABC transporter permease [Deinococcus aetherius]|uniref:ABC transporter permease n=1 Tax=Deinococcus aetherius TaxID=200252 RepID=A0ABM8AG35_9DEIO|nr:carbohydrate ABC transporter permease [Deinococcus aetherius]BDP42620.1 ABC transporter permease [Deinococcus aetherius]
MNPARGLRTLPIYALLLLIALLTLGPFLWSLSTSLRGQGENIYALPAPLFPQHPTLGNFFRLTRELPSPGLWRFFGNSLGLAVLDTTLVLLFSTPMAYALARLRFPGRDLILTLVLVTLLVPGAVQIIPWFLTIQKLGLYNTYLGVALPGAVTAFSIFLLRQGFAAIPNELEEAGRIDGASEWQTFWRIMLPLARPVLATLVIFNFVASLNNFLWPLIVLEDRDLFTLPLGLSYLQSHFSFDQRLITAGAVLATVPSVVIYLLFQREFVRGLEGAVKG